MYGVVALSINPRQPVTPTRTHAVMNTTFYSDPDPSQEDAALSERNVLLQPQDPHRDAAMWDWVQYITDIDTAPYPQSDFLDLLFGDGSAVENGNDSQDLGRRNSVATDPRTCCE